MAFCLPPNQAEKFKKAIIDGTIDPSKLADMDSVGRHAFFANHFGEDAAGPVNSLFESKLLLKNQQEGMINWAKKVMGTNEPAQRDIISKIQRMDKVLNPQDEQAFLGDLAAQKLGIGITFDEAQRIAELSSKVAEGKAAMQAGGDRMDYGRAAVALKNYVGDLVNKASRFSIAEFKRKPVESIVKGASELAGNAKAIKASMDNSAIFRQGWRTLLTHPQVWQANARKSFTDLVSTFGRDSVMDELNADIVSRPTFDLMRRAKLDVGTTEEAYPTALPEHVPVVGRLYRASEVAFSAFVRKTRADVFDKYIDIAQKTGVELDDNELQSIGKLVNSLTGRGHLGSAEPAAGVVNNLFFSPRMVKSQIDTFLQPVTGAGGSHFVRKQAAINLVKILGGTAAILATAKALKKDSVDFDPRSADFGKIKVGDTRFDVTGGMSSLATLAARLATMSSKSSTTGKVHPLNSGKYGSQTGFDVLMNFAENKLSPAASVVKELIKGQTFQGNKPTVANEAVNLLAPLPITTYLELKNDPNSANILAAMIADGLGISVNTYNGIGSNLKISNAPVIKELAEHKVSIPNPAKQDGEAEDAYNLRSEITGKLVESTIKQVLESEDYKGLPVDDKEESRKLAIDEAIKDARGEINKMMRESDYKNLPATDRIELLRGIRSQINQ